MQLETAFEIVEAAREAADELGVPMAIAVVDAGKHPVVMLRMDGALPVAVDTVLAKARTAVQFGCPTGEVLEAARTNPTVYDSFLTATPDPMVYSRGGIPLRVDGALIGAVAASGADGDLDEQVAGAGARLLATA
ncbi:MAG: heme-binding protein [bacterium]|nr:heme-binding protein [bacterium]MDE0289748.1 heme-binding protein [bacterium]MDE0439813.1 heme-binding protein [bacterium]